MNRPTQWDVLFDLAMQIVQQARAAVGHEFSISFGGGTALMLQIDHRESHDIDLFIDDPQILPFLNPDTQDYKIFKNPDDYDTDGNSVTKLIFENLGEIDFICCADITDTPALVKSIRATEIPLELPSEIVAKKVYYRGSRLQPRDMFDLAAVAESYGDQYVIDALRQCGEDRCTSALDVVQAADSQFVKNVVSQLMMRDRTKHLVDCSQEAAKSLLLKSVGQQA